MAKKLAGVAADMIGRPPHREDAAEGPSAAEVATTSS